MLGFVKEIVPFDLRYKTEKKGDENGMACTGCGSIGTVCLTKNSSADGGRIAIKRGAVTFCPTCKSIYPHKGGVIVVIDGAEFKTREIRRRGGMIV